MTKTFTPNDVLRFLYKETSEDEDREIQQAIMIDSNLMDSYQELMEVKNSLDHIEIQAPSQLINKILNYSKSFNLHSISD